MELVHAPVAELKGLLTESFEQWARLRQSSGEPGSSSCALSGGATALIFLPALRAANVNWAKISVFWVDERAVETEDPESNFGLAQRMLLTPLGGRAPRAFRMPVDSADRSLSEAARLYETRLAQELAGRPLDLVLLGVGEDGHVASLFPGHPALLQEHARVVAVEDAPKHPKRRLSLSLRFLLQSREIWIVAVGARKLPVLQAALLRTKRDTPLDLLLQHQAKRVTVFTDQVIRSASTSRRG
jgi:6-phosphogluconolactonase